MTNNFSVWSSIQIKYIIYKIKKMIFNKRLFDITDVYSYKNVVIFISEFQKEASMVRFLQHFSHHLLVLYMNILQNSSNSNGLKIFECLGVLKIHDKQAQQAFYGWSLHYETLNLLPKQASKLLSHQQCLSVSRFWMIKTFKNFIPWEYSQIQWHSQIRWEPRCFYPDVLGLAFCFHQIFGSIPNVSCFCSVSYEETKNTP